MSIIGWSGKPDGVLDGDCERVRALDGVSDCVCVCVRVRDPLAVSVIERVGVCVTEGVADCDGVCVIVRDGVFDTDWLDECDCDDDGVAERVKD